TIAWLDSCATSETPKDFSLLAWCRNGGVGGQTVSPEGQTDVTVHAGKFKAWMIGWHKGVDSTIWVVPSLPFPIKAQVFADVTQDPIPPQYIFELLETGNSSTEPQFLKNIGVAPPPPKNTNCETPNMQTDSIHNSHNIVTVHQYQSRDVQSNSDSHLRRILTQIKNIPTYIMTFLLSTMQARN